MNTTKEQRKEIAIKALKQLGIFKPYIDEFEKNDTVCFFERFAGFWVFQEPEIEAKMKEIEKRHNCTVFAITHEYTECTSNENSCVVAFIRLTTANAAELTVN